MCIVIAAINASVIPRVVVVIIIVVAGIKRGADRSVVEGADAVVAASVAIGLFG